MKISSNNVGVLLHRALKPYPSKFRMNLKPQYRKKTEETSYQPLEELLKRSSFQSSAPRADFQQELLASLKATRRAPKETLMTRLFRLAYLPATLAILTIFVAGGGLYLTRKTATPIVEQPVQITDIKLNPADVPGILTLKPTENTAIGIAATSAFVLETKQAFSEEQIRKSLAFSGDIPYSISKNSANGYLIKPQRALSEGTLVRADMPVTYTTLTGESATYAFSWAFSAGNVSSRLHTPAASGPPASRRTRALKWNFPTRDLRGYEENFDILPKTPDVLRSTKKLWHSFRKSRWNLKRSTPLRSGKTWKLPATGETLSRDIIFQFETEKGPDEWRGFDPYFQKLSNESSTKDAPALVVFGNEKDEGVAVVIYAFPPRMPFATPLLKLKRSRFGPGDPIKHGPILPTG